MDSTLVQVNPELIELLAGKDQPLARALEEHVVLDLYRQGEISTSKGARLLGMDYLTFVRWSGEHGVSYIGYSPEEIKDEVRRFDDLLSGE
jgi:hypothetical protein